MNAMFRPDLASTLKVKRTMEEMDILKIPCIGKEENHPNILQQRPIENFWANLKGRIYDNFFKPKETKH